MAKIVHYQLYFYISKANSAYHQSVIISFCICGIREKYDNSKQKKRLFCRIFGVQNMVDSKKPIIRFWKNE